MLTISKPLSAGQAQAYHKEEFANAQANYYSQNETIRGEWHGKLAEEWGLHGDVQEEHFARLANGQHPMTGEQLVRYQAAREYTNERGETVSTMEHRAGWDATFSAPKSVSLTALVGGDAGWRRPPSFGVCDVPKGHVRRQCFLWRLRRRYTVQLYADPPSHLQSGRAAVHHQRRKGGER